MVQLTCQYKNEIYSTTTGKRSIRWAPPSAALKSFEHRSSGHFDRPRYLRQFFVAAVGILGQYTLGAKNVPPLDLAME